ncbi:MAG: hypothetical protein WCD18_14330 [Thermosynechococcaceae cyanobacterium]
MAHSLQADSTQIHATHLSNMLDSLAYRLTAAKAAHNAHLVALLEQEKRQIEAELTPRNWMRSLQAGVQALETGLQTLLFGSATLQVHEYSAGADHWWYAFDPNTGNCVYSDSEAEVRQWIEENYQGK